MTRMKIFAPAKINLHLDVMEKRTDGFHDIVSIFQIISLFDTITIEASDSTSRVEINGNFDFPVEQNLIYKAVTAFRNFTGLMSGITIECTKEIPEGAGLGGGSSDAASTLIGLNTILGAELTETELSFLGASLGSDIPFFITSATALVTGRGEKVKSVETKWLLPVILINTGIHVSTPHAYRELDMKMSLNKGARDHEIINPVKHYGNYPGEWQFFNDFLSVLVSENPVYSRALSELDRLGALFSSLSGSGSSVFGVFASYNEAKNAEYYLKNKFRGVILVKMLANTPKSVYNSTNN